MFHLFVDRETESKPAFVPTAADGGFNVPLGMSLRLFRLGFYHRLLRSWGLLSKLYVLNTWPLVETSSQDIGSQRVGGSE